MSILQLPKSIDDLELAWLKESYAEGWGKTGKVIAQRNYIYNPSISVNLANINGLVAGVTISRDTVVFETGPASVQVTTDGTMSSQGVQFNNPAVKAIKSGKLRASARVKGPAGAVVNIEVWTNTAGKVFGIGTEGIVYTGEWQTISTPVLNVPAGLESSTVVFVRNPGGVGVAHSFNVDTVVLSEGQGIPEFFDGDTPDNNVFTYEWEGTPHNSSSIKWSKRPVLATAVVNDNTVPSNLGSVVITRNIEDDWTQVVANTALHGARLWAELPSLVGNRTYYYQVEVYNPNSVPIACVLDWCDIVPGTNFTLAPGETRIVKGSATRSTYDITWRFLDIGVITTGQPLWIRNFLVSDSTIGYFGSSNPNTAIVTKSGTEATMVLFDTNANDIGYLEKNYWEKRSGLVPANQYSVSDHKLAALRSSVKTVAGDPLMVTARNLVPNPSMEVDLTGWTTPGSDTTAVRDTTKFKFGTASAKVIANVDKTTNQLRFYYQAIAVKPNTTYYIKGWCASDGSCTIANVNLILLTSTLSFIANSYSSNYNLSSDGTFVEVKHIFTTPSNCHFINFDFKNGIDVLAGAVIWWDGITMSEVDVPYFDGSTSNLTRWVGTPGNSISEMVDGSKNSMADLWTSYLMSRSGLVKGSLADHEFAFYKSQLGL